MQGLIIQLEKPIRISYKGNLREVEILNVSLPNVAGFNLYANIKTIITKTMFELESKINNNNPNSNNSDDSLDKFPIDIFLASDTIIELSNAINKYLIKYAMWDNEISVNEHQIKKLSIQDYNNILERVSYFLYQI